MNKLVFYSSRNVHGRPDATGAFIPEAKKFAKFHGVPAENLIGIDCTKRNKPGNRRAMVIKELRQRQDVELLAFFGHGWPSGIQFGFKKSHISLLVEHVMAADSLKIGLYACLAAENQVRDRDHVNVGPGTDGGFADMLRDKMVQNGIAVGWVDAHKTAGHTSWNPYVVRFLCEDVDDPEFGAKGGGWLVEPRSAYWKKWVRALRRNIGDIRYRFMVEDELTIKKMLAEANV